MYSIFIFDQQEIINQFSKDYGEIVPLLPLAHIVYCLINFLFNNFSEILQSFFISITILYFIHLEIQPKKLKREPLKLAITLFSSVYYLYYFPYLFLMIVTFIIFFFHLCPFFYY